MKPSAEQPDLPAQITQDLLGLVDLLDGVIPAGFERVLLMARHIERLTGGASFATSFEDSANTNTSQSVLADEGRVVSERGAMLRHRRNGRGIEDLELVDPLAVHVYGVMQVAGELERGERTVEDYRFSQASEDKPQALPQENKGELNEMEQDLYILVDLSYSMGHNQRLLLAQTLALWFLAIKFVRQGKRPRVMLRGFAHSIGDLVSAEHMDDLPQVVEEILAADAYEKGTDAQLAFDTALDDIRYKSLNGASVLMLSDGMGVLDPEPLKAKLAADTEIHVAMIGQDEIFLSSAQIEEMSCKLGRPIPSESIERVRTIKGFTEHYNDKIRMAWDNLANEIIAIDDIGEFEVDLAYIDELETYLNEYVFPTDARTVEQFLLRRAMYVYRILDHITSSENLDSALLESSIKLKSELERWISPQIEFELDLFAKGKKSKSTGALKLGNNKVNFALKLFNSTGNGNFMVDKKKLIMKLIRKLLKRFGIIKE